MKVGDVFSYKDSFIEIIGIVLKIEKDIWYLKLFSSPFSNIHSHFAKDSLIATESEILCSVEQPFDKS